MPSSKHSASEEPQGRHYFGQTAHDDWLLQAELKPIGSTMSILAEASDALGNPAFLLDGRSGDVDFPFGAFQPILTIGEFDAESCHLPTGKPDGQGVYLPSLNTVRLVYQSENVGHLVGGNPTYYFAVRESSLSVYTDSQTYAFLLAAPLAAALLMILIPLLPGLSCFFDLLTMTSRFHLVVDTVNNANTGERRRRKLHRLSCSLH